MTKSPVFRYDAQSVRKKKSEFFLLYWNTFDLNAKFSSSSANFLQPGETI